MKAVTVCTNINCSLNEACMRMIKSGYSKKRKKSKHFRKRLRLSVSVKKDQEYFSTSSLDANWLMPTHIANKKCDQKTYINKKKMMIRLAHTILDVTIESVPAKLWLMIDWWEWWRCVHKECVKVFVCKRKNIKEKNKSKS